MDQFTATVGVSEKALGKDQQILFRVPGCPCNGRMDFIKRGGPGDEIYIKLGGKNVSANDYDIILTDSGTEPGPVYTLNGIIAGDVNAATKLGTAIITATAFMAERQ